MSDTTPTTEKDPWLSAEWQSGSEDALELGRNPYDVRTSVDLVTAIYTDLDTGETRTWWQQRMHIQSRQMRLARELAQVRQVSSDMQALWGRKPYFRDDWFGDYIPEYRLPNPRADLTRLQALYGGDGPYPDGPYPGTY